jgi:hypothetical protein
VDEFADALLLFLGHIGHIGHNFTIRFARRPIASAHSTFTRFVSAALLTICAFRLICARFSPGHIYTLHLYLKGTAVGTEGTFTFTSVEKLKSEDPESDPTDPTVVYTSESIFLINNLGSGPNYGKALLMLRAYPTTQWSRFSSSTWSAEAKKSDWQL